MSNRRSCVSERCERRRRITLRSSRRAVEKLEEATELDPGSARAHATLASAYIMVGITDGPREPSATLARRAAERARELDSTSGEAYGSLGRILFHFGWNAENGLQDMQRALELEPNNPFVLDRLHAERWPWMPSLRHDPEWDPLRADARFERLMTSVDERLPRQTTRLELTQPR